MRFSLANETLRFAEFKQLICRRVGQAGKEPVRGEIK